jgi:ABC-2 type transport system ATP-binding protein
MLATLILPSGGSATVAGFDLAREPGQVRRRIGYVGQAGGADDAATARENLLLQARLYGLSPAEARRRSEALVEALQLAEFADRPVRTCSGGQRRRLDIALALTHRPDVLFLDEPTTGLDPQARHNIWAIVERMQQRGKTVVMTTHYMEEAEHLCDRVLIIDRGHIVALDTPENLVSGLRGETRVIFTVEPGYDPAPLRSVPGVSRVERAGDKITVAGGGERFVILVVNALDAQGARFRDLRTEQPSLDDVFMAMTEDDTTTKGAGQ